MSAWIMGAATVFSAGVSLYNSNKQSQASQASVDWSKQMYGNSVNFFNSQQGRNEGLWSAGTNVLRRPAPTVEGSYMEGSYADVQYASAAMASASLAEAFMAESYDMEAFRAEAYRVEMDGFLASFKEATESADLSLDTFNRRYGAIMDNLQQAVLDVERERFASQGREQLMLDADNWKKNLDDSIAKAGLARSGVTLEMQQRMDMEIGRQARAVDVNSYAQSGQLQAQTVGALGGLTALRESIASRQEAIALGRGQGQLNASMQNAALKTQVSQQWAANQQQASMVNAQNKTNVSLANAQNKTNVSMHNSNMLTNVSLANAAAQTKVSMFNAGAYNQNSMFNASVDNAVSQFNASVDNSVNMFNTSNAINQQNALASAYLNRAQSGFNAESSFYSGVGQAGASGVGNAYSNQATAYGNAAAGWAQAAGYTFGKATENWWNQSTKTGG
jgi:hypothetical protein